METIILTVLITLGVCIVSYAFIGVVRLQKSFEEVVELRMELIDQDLKMEKMYENFDRDIRETHENMERDYINRIDKWVASTDRRFDKLYALELGGRDKINNTPKPVEDLHISKILNK